MEKNSVGRISKNLKLVQRIEKPNSANGIEVLPLLWGHLFDYYCDVWRDRCFYADLLQRQMEYKELDMEITQVLKRDWTVLHRKDRGLLYQIPENTASTAHKKGWLFQVECAFEYADFSLDFTQRNLFDFGFGIFDPV